LGCHLPEAAPQPLFGPFELQRMVEPAIAERIHNIVDSFLGAESRRSAWQVVAAVVMRVTLIPYDVTAKALEAKPQLMQLPQRDVHSLLTPGLVHTHKRLDMGFCNLAHTKQTEERPVSVLKLALAHKKKYRRMAKEQRVVGSSLAVACDQPVPLDDELCLPLATTKGEPLTVEQETELERRLRVSLGMQPRLVLQELEFYSPRAQTELGECPPAAIEGRSPISHSA
jgi:hypothetical protein